MTKSQFATPASPDRRSEHRKDRRVGMIERDRADSVKSPQIISIRSVVAVPCDNIERRMIDLARPEIPAKFCDDLDAGRPCPRTRRPAFQNRVHSRGHSHRSARDRAGETAGRSFRRCSRGTALIVRSAARHLKFQPPRYHRRSMPRPDLQQPKLGQNPKPSHLRHDQHLAVGIVKIPVAHALVAGIDMNRRCRPAKTGRRCPRSSRCRRQNRSARVGIGSGSQRS